LHDVATRIPVTFEGEGAGEGEMTWGQQEIWHTIQRTGRTLNIGGVLPLPPSATIGEFTRLLEFLVGRHQALRTRFRAVGSGPPRQVLSSSGTVHLDVVDAPAAADAAADAAAEALRSRYEFTPFDYAAEFPVRMGVIRAGDRLTHLVVQYCHLAVDGFGIEAVIRDLAQVPDAATADPPPAVDSVRPLELAARQQSPAGRRQSEKSLRYWEAQLDGVPPARFGVSDDPRTPRFWELVCHSPALHLALQMVAARTRAETGHVLLAAYAVAMARVTGRRPSVAQVLVSNRFRPGFADAVCHLTQPGLFVIDTPPGLAFDELVGRVWKSATAAYLHGYYDPAAHRAMLDRLAAERGAPVDLSCFVNDRRGAVPTMSTVDAPTPADVRAALPATTMRWDRRLPTYDGTFYLQVDATPDAVDFAIWADTHALSPAQVEACARELESAAVTAALS